MVSITGTVLLTVLCLTIANHPVVQDYSMVVPFYNLLPEATLETRSLILALVPVVLAVTIALSPLYKPQPRRVLTVITQTQQRVVIAVFGIVTLGYFDYTFRLPRSTVVLMTALLLVSIPAWHILIRPQNRSKEETVLIVGDDPGQLSELLDTIDSSVFGYVSIHEPEFEADSIDPTGDTYTDGGSVSIAANPYGLPYLGDLSQLDEILTVHDVDTVAIAFKQLDRKALFRTLDTCYTNGVTATVHRELEDSVLTRDSLTPSQLVEIELEPWDWQDRMLKRIFDVTFSTVGLVVLSPLVLVISVAIKLDSRGPIIYTQERTSTFGGTFTVYKFRSMVDNAEAETGAKISDEDAGAVDPRVTRVGRVLRKTHLDELPQLYSILVGDMSVVGPRPERPEIDQEISSDMAGWRQRWFVKPGLTGLAQINDVTGHEPDRKLRYDMRYIKQQSLWFDLKIVMNQIYKVIGDVFR